MFMGLKGQSKVKLPGSINGQQFIIDSCEDCDIYVLDHCDMVTIDDCKNCRIFIGPCESSVFIRTSSNCKCAFIARQLRTRDCQSCDILLLCRTRPIIESSSAMGFACHSCTYQGLEQQLAACKLSLLHNFWSHIHDFTPPSDGTRNWHPLPNSTTWASLIGGAVAEEAKAFFSPSPQTLEAERVGAARTSTAAAEASRAASPAGSSSSSSKASNKKGSSKGSSAEGSRASTPGPSNRIAPKTPASPSGAQAPGAAHGSRASSPASNSSSASPAALSSSQKPNQGLHGLRASTPSPGGSRSSTPGVNGAGACSAAAASAECLVLLQTLGDLLPPQEYDTLLFMLFPSQIGCAAVVKMLRRVGCQVSSQDSSCSMLGEAAVAAEDGSSCSSVLLRTNEALVPEGLLQQMALRADWSKTQIREFGAKDARAPCVGVEVATQSSWEQDITEQAARLGGACTKNQDVAKMFMYLGVDG